ncbi:family 43 glycosylhydrolase [Streptomyces mayteni]
MSDNATTSGSRQPGAPLYTDPLYDAPADPTVIEAPDGSWRMFYTQRRAHDDGPGVRWVHGTDIGVAGSVDGGLTWNYLGAVAGLDPHPGRNTLWAPEVVHAEGRYHMFLSHIRGVPSTWAGHPRTIRHLVSDDLEVWHDLGVVPLSSDRVIDACVHPLPDGGYRMWFKDEADGSTTWAADSPDLTAWSAARRVVGDPPHEGPNVFELGGWYWMVTDEWRGLGVHRSTDLAGWERQGLILDTPGRRPFDGANGQHADVVVGFEDDGAAEEVGWIFYFTHRPEPAGRHTDVQVATLRVVDGRLVCDRDGPTRLDLRRARRG